MEQVSYFGQPSSYFSYTTKIQEILEAFDFPTQRISGVFDDRTEVGTEEYIIEGDGLTFTITISPEGRIDCEFDGKTEFIGSVDDEPEETSHYIDVILNGPTEDLRTLFEGLIREDKQTDIFNDFKTLDIDWGKDTQDDENLKKEVFDSFFERDKSPTKKYLSWLISQAKGIKKLDWIQFLNNTATVSDMMLFIDKRVLKKDVEELEIRVKNGDLKNFGNTFDRIIKSPKDINSYPDINSIREFFNQIKQRTYTTDEIKQAKSDSKKLYEDDKYLIVQPLTHQASCVYGAETKWCVSSRDSSKYFDDYTKNSKFVYVINKKSRDRTSSKFALRLFDNEKPEIWNQQDKRTSFEVLYTAMPGIDEILNKILNIGGNDYQMLVNYKNGKTDTMYNASDGSANFEIVEGNIQLFFDSDDYFELFVNQLYDYSLSQLKSSVGNNYGRQTEWVDSYSSEDDWKEGYLLQSLDESNQKKLDEIIKIISPQTYFDKERLTEENLTNYFSECSKVLNSHNKFTEQIVDGYTDALNEAFTEGIDNAIDEEYCNVLKTIGIESQVCFRKYYTTVDNMLLLYDKYGTPQKSIRQVIISSIDEEISVTDIFDNYYEYRDDSTFDSNFNFKSNELLDELLESLMDEEDGVFDDIEEYQKIVSYIIDKIGFNVRKDIPTLKDTQITIVGVEPDNSILVQIQKNIGYSAKVKKYTLAFEQLISLFKNYQLFEI